MVHLRVTPVRLHWQQTPAFRLGHREQNQDACSQAWTIACKCQLDKACSPLFKWDLQTTDAWKTTVSPGPTSATTGTVTQSHPGFSMLLLNGSYSDKTNDEKMQETGFAQHIWVVSTQASPEVLLLEGHHSSEMLSWQNNFHVSVDVEQRKHTFPDIRKCLKQPTGDTVNLYSFIWRTWASLLQEKILHRVTREWKRHQ